MCARHDMKLLLLACALVSCCAAASPSDSHLTTNEELSTDGQLTLIEELTTEDQVPTTEDQVPTTEVVASEDQVTTTEETVMSPKYETSPFLETTTIVSTPPVVFIVNIEGDIQRSLQKDPAQCEVFHHSAGNSLVAHMESIYLSNYYGILRCASTTKHSCQNIYEASNPVLSVTIGDGKIFAGLKNGTVLVSELHQTNGFRTLHTFTGRAIYSLKLMDRWLYAGLDNGHLMRCSTTEYNACTLRYDMKTYITGLANIRDTIIGITLDGRLWNCSHKHETSDCVSVASNFIRPRAVTVFSGDLYVLKEKESIYKCKWGNDPLCSKYAESRNALDMAFVYGTHQLQPQYRDENRACTWQRHSMCPPYVTYYDVQQRAPLKVHVKDGKLYNNVGALVDTRDADEGHSGPAAIFAMSPDGTILLSNTHKKGMFHISSLFAGSPVSGAGEIVVKDGEIQKIMACSDHYLPDIELNKQVIQSLSSQGYTKHVLSVPCGSPDTYNTCANY